jgi:hypothetical protein
MTSENSSQSGGGWMIVHLTAISYAVIGPWMVCLDITDTSVNISIKVWRCQSDNQQPQIERQTRQWPKEKGQTLVMIMVFSATFNNISNNDLQNTTKKTTDRATRTLLKTGDRLRSNMNPTENRGWTQKQHEPYWKPGMDSEATRTLLKTGDGLRSNRNPTENRGWTQVLNFYSILVFWFNERVFRYCVFPNDMQYVLIPLNHWQIQSIIDC